MLADSTELRASSWQLPNLKESNRNISHRLLPVFAVASLALEGPAVQ